MKEENKREKQLLKENQELRQRVIELEASEEKLKEREKRYRFLVNNTKDLIAVVNKQGKIVFANKPGFQFGYTKEEVIGKSITNFLTKDCVKKAFYTLSQEFLGNPQPEIEVSVKAKGNGIRYLKVARDSSFVYEKGKLIGLMVCATDITEQKRAQESIKTEKAYLDQLFESGPEANAIVDNEGNILRINKKFSQLFGYKSDEAVGKQLDELVAPEDYLKEARSITGRIAKGEEVEVESLRQHKNGTLIDVSIIGSPIIINQKQVAQYAIYRDITERMKAEKDLKESEEKYRTLTENINVGIYRNTPGPRGKFIEANPTIVRMFGYKSIKEFLRIYVSDLYLNPKDREKFNQKILRDGFVRNEEIRLKRKDGTPFWGAVTAVAVGDEKGNIEYYDGIVEDITEQKGMEEELRKSEEKYRTVFENTGTATTILEEDKTISLANEEFEKLSGFSRREIEGKKKWTEFVVKEDLERMKEYHNSRRSDLGSAPIRYEFRFIGRNGKVKDIFISIDMIPGTKKSVASLLDITERKKAEREFKKERAYLDQLIENAKETIVMGDNKGKIKRVNPEFTNLFGYTKEEAVGKFIDDLIAPHTYHKKAVEITKRMEEGSSISRETKRRRKDGKLIDVSLIGSPIEFNGKQVGIYGIYRDITERKHAERRLKASLREKEIMLREIHHRVKNNLQIIISLLRLQSTRIKDKRDKILYSESQNRIRSMALIHEKLYESKNLARINFAHYLRNFTTHLFHTYMVDPNTIGLSTELEDVFIDINRAVPCGLIINELVSNALEYAFPKGRRGEIRIKFYSDKKDKINLIVSDNGVGLPEDVDLRSPQSLGMQLVNDLVKQIGGTVDVKRKIGTTFEIRFP